MDLRTLTRDPAKVLSVLAENGDSLLVKQDCKIYVPVLWEEKGLVSIGNEVIIPAVFAISVEDKYYGVSLAITNLTITPSETNTVDTPDGRYYEFVFDAGSVLCPDLETPRVQELAYYIFDLFVSSGKIPMFLSYIDLASLFMEAEYHVGLRLGANVAVIPMIIATIARLKSDRTRYYRHAIKDISEVTTNPPVYISFSDVTYNATNTVAKLMGAYYNLGVNSALANPSERLEQFEIPLRT